MNQERVAPFRNQDSGSCQTSGVEGVISTRATIKHRPIARSETQFVIYGRQSASAITQPRVKSLSAKWNKHESLIQTNDVVAAPVALRVAIHCANPTLEFVGNVTGVLVSMKQPPALFTRRWPILQKGFHYFLIGRRLGL